MEFKAFNRVSSSAPAGEAARRCRTGASKPSTCCAPAQRVLQGPPLRLPAGGSRAGDPAAVPCWAPRSRFLPCSFGPQQGQHRRFLPWPPRRARAATPAASQLRNSAASVPGCVQGWPPRQRLVYGPRLPASQGRSPQPSPETRPRPRVIVTAQSPEYMAPGPRARAPALPGRGQRPPGTCQP